MRLAVCAEMVYLDLPITERVQRIAEAGFDAEIWDWTRHDVEALAATGALVWTMTGYIRGDFGDGAAAAVIGPAAEGEAPDIEMMQTYAGGPWSEVNSIVLPNPEFNNDVTVYGPEVKSLAGRYLVQMIGDLSAAKAEDGQTPMLDTIEMVIPHQANKTMVEKLADAAKVPRETLYFDIARVGNTSAASIPIAIRDAVAEGRIDRPMRVFAPGFGAGSVAGYVVVRIDPAVVNIEKQPIVAVDEAGDEKMSLAGRVVLVTDDAIRQAQQSLWDTARLVAEPGGVAALSALLSAAYVPAPGERVGVVLSGANTTAVDFSAH